MSRCTPRALRPLLVVVTIIALLAPAVASAQEATPPPALPPPPVTVQQVLNELLPLIRQFDPVLKQVGALVAQLDPLIAAGGDFATQLDALTSQLEPFVAQVAPLAAQLAALLEPAWSTIDTQASPQVQMLLGMLAPYVNQVDLATAFQVIGPIAPTVLKAIPLSNQFYNSIDVIAPLRDPFTCPLARALPQQKVIDIVVPFLCYNTIVNGDVLGGGSTPPPDLGGGDELPADSGDGTGGEGVAEVGTEPTDATELASATPETAAASLGSSGSGSIADAAGSSSPTGPSSASAGTDTELTSAPPLVATSSDEVKRLEDRLRLMAALLIGLALLAWSLFRPASTDGRAGLGMFRKDRFPPPPKP